MKRILSTGAFVAGVMLAPSAMAADLPAISSEPAVYSPAPVFTWDGFYVGANVGYGWGRGRLTNGAVTGTGNYDGFLGGLQAGYNVQFSSNLVVGLETDMQLSGVDHNEDVGPFSTNAKIDWFGTTRARLGYAAGRFMPYITGGVAYGHHKFKVSLAGTQIASESKNQVGWTLGAGVEAALTQHVSMKAEYLYVDFNRKTYPAAGFRADENMHVGRIGLNYRF